MKLIPTFNQNSLSLIGHGLMPWLFSLKFEFTDKLVWTKKKFGHTQIKFLSKQDVKFHYDGLNLSVMNYKIKAKTLLAHQLHQWLLNWKNND